MHQLRWSFEAKPRCNPRGPGVACPGGACICPEGGKALIIIIIKACRGMHPAGRPEASGFAPMIPPPPPIGPSPGEACRGGGEERGPRQAN